MKTKKIAKIALLALSLVMMTAIFATTSNASTAPEITNMNVMYTDKFCLVYAVPAETVQGGSATLYLYEDYPVDSGVEPINTYEVSKTTSAEDSGLDYEAYIFYTDGVAAMALDKVFYSKVVDAEGNVSSVKSYSVVEYLYTRLAEVDNKPNTPEQNEFYKSTIAFGTAAQQNFLSEEKLAETTLISDYFYLTTVGCTVNGKTSGVFPKNQPLEIAYDRPSGSAYNMDVYTSYDTTELDSTTTVAGSNLLVTDGHRIHIDANAAIVRTYRDGVMTFDGESVGAAPSILNTSAATLGDGYFLTADASNIRKNNSKVAQDTVYGEVSNVLKITPTSNGRLFVGTLNGLTGDDVANATATEFSFDFRVDTSNMADWENFTFETVFAKGGSSEKSMTNVRFTLLANGTIQVEYLVDGAASGTIIPVTIFANDYNNFRMVARVDAETGKKYIDVFVNNFSDIPDASFESQAYNSSADTISAVTDIDRALFCMMTAANTGVSFYLDNIWCGYTAD